MTTAQATRKKENSMEFQSRLLEGNVAEVLLRINREQSERFVKNAKLSRQTHREPVPDRTHNLVQMHGF